MFRALACLVFAMTACGALLTWMAPPDPATVTLEDPAYPLRQAEQAVSLNDDVAVLDWREIELVVPPDAPTPGATVLFAPGAPDCHFVVSQAGVIHAARAWKRQVSLRGSSAPVVVVLSPAADVGDMPIAQWIGLRALLCELLDRTTIARHAGPHIRVARTANSSSRRAMALRQWLRHEGLPVQER